MVRATSRTKKKSTNSKGINKTDAGVSSATKAFSSIRFTVKSFKKKAKSSKKGNKLSSIPGGLKSIHNLLKSTKKSLSKAQQTSKQSTAVPLTKVYRNKPKKNYTNKSSHLSNVTAFKSKLIDDEQNTDKQNAPPIKRNKKTKRSQRRKQLKQRIESATKWTMDKNNTEVIVENNTCTKSNEEAMNIQSLRDSLKETEKEIVLQRKVKNRSKSKRQVRNDRDNITALFTNDLFDSNPIEYTNNRLKQEHDALNMKSEIELKEQNVLLSLNKSLNGKKQKKNQRNGANKSDYKMRKKERKCRSLLSDNELKKQITKQMTLIKQKSANKKQLKLISKCNKKIKLKKKKNGKYLEKKMRKKMSHMAKTNQKKRRWRI
eukprot:169449_1